MRSAQRCEMMRVWNDFTNRLWIYLVPDRTSLWASSAASVSRLDGKPSKQIKTQKADVVNATITITTTSSAQPSELRSLGLSSKSGVQRMVTRVFHGIYNTNEG